MPLTLRVTEGLLKVFKTRRIFLTGAAATVAACALATEPAAQSSAAGDALVASASAADAALDQALTRFVQYPDGPPGAVALVQRGNQKVLHRAGTAKLANKAPIQRRGRALGGCRWPTVPRRHYRKVAAFSAPGLVKGNIAGASEPHQRRSGL